MHIVFASSQRYEGSTIQGRILPLAERLARQHTVTLLTVGRLPSVQPPGLSLVRVGREPFTRTAAGKQRQAGWQLVLTMAGIAWQTARALAAVPAEVVVIVKPLPATVAGVWLARWWGAARSVVLDADDFELTANQLSSLTQRLAIHWAERRALKLATLATAATPFLVDHLRLLRPNQPVHLLPTGIALSDIGASVEPATPLLLYAGSLSAASGHRVDLLPGILAAVRRTHPAARLRIAGDGDDADAVRAAFAAAHLDSAVEWVGRFTRADLPSLLAGVAVILDPIDASITQRAKSSFRVAVAAAAGIPVVSSNVGIRPHWLPDYLHERFFARPADALDYAATVGELLAHPLTQTDRAAMQTRARQFHWDVLAIQFATYVQAARR